MSDIQDNQTESAAPVTHEQSDSVAVPTAKKTNNKALYIIMAVVLVLFILPGIALGVGLKYLGSKAGDKIAEKGVESLVSSATGGKVDVNSKDGSFNVSSKDGDSSISIGGNQKLPDDFPKNDIPYIKESGVTAVFTSINENKKSWTITTNVDKSFSEAKAYYEAQLKEPIYTDVSTYGFANSQTYYGKSSKYSVTVTVSAGEEGAKTNVTYIVSQE